MKEIMYKGQCYHCTWEIDEEWALTIGPSAGTDGLLSEEGESPERGWRPYRQRIKSVHIKEGVKAGSDITCLFSGFVQCRVFDVAALDTSRTRNISKAIPQSKITWIANPVSKEAYGYGMDSQRFEMVKTNFESIKGKTWDLIFLCRSDIWSPPHLDIDFDSLAKLIMETSAECRYTSDIMCPRFESETFLQSIEAQEKIYKKVYEDRILARAGLLNERRRK